MILSPVKLGSVEVRNRVVITAHGASEMFRNPLLPATPYIEYLRRRAAGGVGLIIAQALYVNPLTEYPDEFTERHARLAKAVKSEGATLILQLVHLGATFRSESDVHRPPLWTFSTTMTDQGEVAHAMTDEQIEMMIAGYGRIARMAAEAGLDGCEVHGAHGYIGQQSISPWLNRRTDKWGQDRTLFLRRVIETVRREIGPDRILGYRTTTDDMRSPEDGGLGVDGAIGTVRAVLATGEIDVLNTTVGHGGKTYARAIPSYRLGEAVNMPKARHLGDAIGHQVPLIGVGRIASVGIAESLLQSGACDLVAMTRAHIADPDIVAKFARGEAHRIRPCVGALVCNSRKLAGFSEISCVHNPEVLREHELRLEPAAEPKRVIVAGAGPAGLKFAEIAARRGHQVRVYDSAPRTRGRLSGGEDGRVRPRQHRRPPDRGAGPAVGAGHPGRHRRCSMLRRRPRITSSWPPAPSRIPARRSSAPPPRRCSPRPRPSPTTHGSTRTCSSTTCSAPTRVRWSPRPWRTPGGASAW